ncbi:MAG: hypothetical protein V4565_15090 [Bacteroidota bacterium]
MESFKIFFLIFCISVFNKHYAQKVNSSLLLKTDSETTVLINKYFTSPDNPEQKIIVLLKESRNPGHDFSSSLKKMSVALALEKYVSYPCKATFDLNSFMGDIFRDINIPFAISYYEKAITIGLNTTEKVDLFNVYNILAGLYYRINDHSNVINNYTKALNEVKGINLSSVSSVNNNIGWYYSQIGSNDSAMAYYQKAKKYSEMKGRDDELYSSILENIAKIDEINGNYENALKIYSFNERFYLNHRGISFFIRNKVRMLIVQSLAGKAVRNSIDSLTKVIDANINDVVEKDALKYYQFCYAYFIKIDDSKFADIYIKRYLNLKEFIMKKDIEKANSLSNALLNVQNLNFQGDYEIHKLALETANQTSKKNRIIAILFFLSAVLMFMVFVFYKKKKKKELEMTKKMGEAGLKSKDLEAKAMKADLENVRLQAEAEIFKKDMERKVAESEFEKERVLVKQEIANKDHKSKVMEKELELKKKDLTNVILHHTHTYESNQEMIEKLEQASRNDDLGGSVKYLLNDLKSKNHIADRFSSFQNNIDHLNTEFYQKLKQKFPNLTKAETELCGFILINLSNKDISILKNVEASSVKMSKTRLRKKLGINPDEDLLNFIQKI